MPQFYLASVILSPLSTAPLLLLRQLPTPALLLSQQQSSSTFCNNPTSGGLACMTVNDHALFIWESKDVSEWYTMISREC
ncbi:hypothetical protein BDR05DRAFT_967302 [Suillus weaverae]|nr:hypothetical protein BDR05DRAFT_967302 [Suillus weaverae]